jgi:hypothetical protein
MPKGFKPHEYLRDLFTAPLIRVLEINDNVVGFAVAIAGCESHPTCLDWPQRKPDDDL